MNAIDLVDIQEAVRLSGLNGYTGRFQALGGGEVNDTFALELETKKVVLRVARHPGQNTLDQEATALKLLNLDSAPKLIYFDEKSKLRGRTWILESYLSGSSPARLNEAQFRNLGKLLANIHKVTSPKIGVNIWASFLDVSKDFGNEQKLLNHPDPKLRILINQAYKDFKDYQPNLDHIIPSLLHGDATPSNTLVNDDSISLIDWEFSKFGDPMADFSTVYYEDMEYNQGKWRVQITAREKVALFEGYQQEGGEVDEQRIQLWMNFDKLGAATFSYWRINESGHPASPEQLAQYQLDLDNLISSLS